MGADSLSNQVCSEGAYDRPMIVPSLDCSRATVWPHGLVRAWWSNVKLLSVNSSAATCTARASATSNSTLACGTVRSAGQWGVPKQVGATCVRGQTPKDVQPVDLFAVQVAVIFYGRRQSKGVHVQPSADAGVGVITATLVMS